MANEIWRSLRGGGRKTYGEQVVERLQELRRARHQSGEVVNRSIEEWLSIRELNQAGEELLSRYDSGTATAEECQRLIDQAEHMLPHDRLPEWYDLLVRLRDKLEKAKKAAKPRSPEDRRRSMDLD